MLAIINVATSLLARYSTASGAAADRDVVEGAVGNTCTYMYVVSVLFPTCLFFSLATLVASRSELLGSNLKENFVQSLSLFTRHASLLTNQNATFSGKFLFYSCFSPFINRTTMIIQIRPRTIDRSVFQVSNSVEYV